jgi:hypothetical protein
MPTSLADYRSRHLLLAGCALTALTAMSSVARAQSDAPAVAAPAATAAAPEAPPWAPPASFGEWASGIKFTGQVEAGIVGNPQSPNNGQNFGQLFTDKANDVILNQLLLTLERDLDPKATDYDFAFKLQGMYGSDARIIHSLGLFDHAIHDRNQIDIVEANISVHTPWLSEGGVDFKGGIYPTPLGFEVINPALNPFYSHSYIFNYGLPFKHLGLLATWHATPIVDLYLGIDTGTNTTISDGDNNKRPGGIFGFGLNLMGGDLTVLALTHLGPEDSTLNTSFGNSAMRYFNDIVVTWKTTPALTLTGELNYVREEGFHAEAYGAAGYASYTLTDTLTLNGRAEVYRDNNNFFVANPVNNLDYVNFERGVPSNFYTASRPTTYSELTAGVTYKPAGMPAPLTGLMVRPEIRYDHTLNNSKPYDDGKDRGSVTLAADVIVQF